MPEDRAPGLSLRDKFKAVVLAGERPGGSDFSRALGLPASVLVDVAGKSAVARVIEALESSDWVDGGAGMPTAQNLLIYERQVNLYLQGHRLNDMYRFGIESDRWEASSTAASAPGTFFPITKAEIDANCYINPDWPAGSACPPEG